MNGSAPHRALVRATLLTIVLAVAVTGALAAQVDQASEGGKLFQQYCVGCHTIGKGNLVGPDLKGVTTLRDHQWLVDWITAPDKMVAKGDPTAVALVKQFPALTMPSLGLSATQIDAILAYLAAQSGEPPAASPPAAAPLLAGDVARGKDLFTGRTRFTNGGTACMACHSAAGIGALGGGQLGPDLTQSVNKFGEAGLDAFIAQPPTQTMSAVWTPHPLTPQERADVRAFLTQAAVSGRPVNTVLQLAAFAVVGALLLLALAQVIWRRRLRDVRRPLVARSRR